VSSAAPVVPQRAIPCAAAGCAAASPPLHAVPLLPDHASTASGAVPYCVSWSTVYVLSALVYTLCAGSQFSSRFTYVTTNDGVVGIRATAVGPGVGRTALYQCTVRRA